MFLSRKLLYRKVYDEPLRAQKRFQVALNKLSNKSFVSKASIVILGLSGLLWTMQRLNNVVIFPVHHIKVAGHLPVDEKKRITQTIVSFTTKGLLQVNVRGLKANLQQLSWIESVVVKRALPSTLVVQVNARQPIALFRGMDSNVEHCMDKQGNVFECKTQQSGSAASLPHLTGPTHEAEGLLALYQKANHMLNRHAITVTGLSVDDKKRVSIQLDNGIQLWLGHQTPLNQLKKLITMHPLSLHQSNQIATIDLRYPRGMAVMFHESRFTS